MTPAERKTCRCGKKARLNRELCLDCELEGIKAGARRDAPLGKMPTAEELMDLARRERAGTPPVIAAGDFIAPGAIAIPASEGESIGVGCAPRTDPNPLSVGAAHPTKKAAAEKENLMEKEKAKCSECLNEPPEGKRLYKGKCEDCRSKGKAPRKARKAPSPLAGEGAKAMCPKCECMPCFCAPASPTQDELILKLQGAINYHAEEARRNRIALEVLKDLTGSDIEVPEVKL